MDQDDSQQQSMTLTLDLSSDFEFHIGVHKWECIFVEDDVLDDGIYGDCNSVKYRIRIRSDLPYSMRLSTFIHELMHAIESICSLDFPHKDLNIFGDAIAGVLIANFEQSTEQDAAE